jgi:hypothetical protein
VLIMTLEGREASVERMADEIDDERLRRALMQSLCAML